MAQIRYIVGDATAPIGDGNKLIIHICNNRGGFGKGFALALAEKWPEAKHSYKAWHNFDRGNFQLGEARYHFMERYIWVVHMIAQEGYSSPGKPAIRYDALRKCLRRVAGFASVLGASIHCPRIGAGLAGGDWVVIEKMIQEELVDKGFDVFVYDLE